MARIGNVDHVLLLLREQLQRVAKGRSAPRGAAADRVGASAARPLDRVRALAALDSLDEDEVRRAVVRGILTEEFGERVGNDAALQAIVDDVVRIIGDTPGGIELIDSAVAQLREIRA
jgi:hypothetical protein